MLRRIRFSMRSILMLVLTAAAASALFAKVSSLLAGRPSDWRVDAPALLLLGIGLTALAIGTVRRHTAFQTMLQATLSCVMLLVLVQFTDLRNDFRAIRAALYWFQGVFALTVALPLLAWRLLLAEMEVGGRRDWWRGTMEAVVASFFNLALVAIGALLQLLTLEVSGALL